MKRLIFLLLLSFPTLAQVQVIDSSSHVIVQDFSGRRAYPKTSVGTKFADGKLVLMNGEQVIRTITSNTEVSSPASISMSDLESKIIGIISAGISASDIAKAVTVKSFGDSFTQGVGGTSYPSQYALLTGLNVVNEGVGGETSTQIKTRFDADVANRGSAHIIWSGRNDITAGTTIETVKSNVAAMVAALGHNRYVIVGSMNRSTELSGNANFTAVTALNAYFAATYPGRYFDVKAYLMTKGTGTGQDATDVGNSVVPASLRSDDLHPNALGYYWVAVGLNQFTDVLLGEYKNRTLTISSLVASQAKTSVSKTASETIAGDKTFTGALTVGNILPSANNSLIMGNASFRFLSIYSGAFLSSSIAQYGTTNTSTYTEFRSGSSSQISFKLHATTGNATFQTPAASPSDIVSARLQVNSTTQGFLAPRMTSTQRDAIASPAAGLMIINITTPTAATLEFYNGTTWKTVTTN